MEWPAHLPIVGGGGVTKLPYFDPTHWTDFRTGFRVGNK